MNPLVAIPIAAPLIGGILTLLFARDHRLQAMVAVLASAVTTGASLALLLDVKNNGTQVMQAGAWNAPLGISLVADMFAVLVLVAAQVTVLTVLIFAIGHPATTEHAKAFHPLYLVMVTGVSLSFLSGDFFNLYVAFEVMLAASYMLLTLGGSREQIRRAMTYVVISLFASVLFITALGIIYAAVGTMNMADISVKLQELPSETTTALSLFLFVVFGIKAAIFPVFSWLPDSYPTAPAPITAIFAGLSTKVGVYALVRTQTLMFPRDEPWTIIVILAALTMIVGVLAAIAQNDMKRILSYMIVSQIGYMIMGLSLFTVAGIAATVFSLVHHMPVKTSLFLSEGLIEDAAGSSKLNNISGLLTKSPYLATLFGLSALSLAGVPPFSGFVSKVSVITAGFDAGEWVLTSVSLVVGVLTIFSLARIWNGVFWGPQRAESLPPTGAVNTSTEWGRRMMYGAASACVGITLVIAILAGPIFELSTRAAEELMDPTGYQELVLNP